MSRRPDAEVLVVVTSAGPSASAQLGALASRLPGVGVHLVPLDGSTAPDPPGPGRVGGQTPPAATPHRRLWARWRRGGSTAATAALGPPHPAGGPEPAPVSEPTTGPEPAVASEPAEVPPLDRWTGTAHTRLRVALTGHPDAVLVVALDRGAAGVAWTAAALGRLTLPIVEGVEPAVRLLSEGAALDPGDIALSARALVVARDDYVFAALPDVLPRRPRALVRLAPSAPGTESVAFARHVHDALDGRADVVCVVAAADDQGLALERDRALLVVRVDPAEVSAPDGRPGDVAESLHADATVADAAGIEAAREVVLARSGPSPDQRGGTRLLVGPANYADQGVGWARAVEDFLGGVQAQSLQVASPHAPFLFPADLPLAPADWVDPVVRARAALDGLLPATHVLLESLRPVLGASFGRGGGTHPWDVELGVADVHALAAAGKRVALLLHGSEIREPAVHAARDANSPFAREEFAAETRKRAVHTGIVHEGLAGLDPEEFPRFVASPDLLAFLPHATWLPFTLARGWFRPAPPVLERDRPVVVHAPTNDVLKGTDRIDPVLERLDAQGRIEYRRLRGVPPSAVMGYLRDTDVLVDQVTVGNPGVLAAQAMAAGRLVVAHLAPATRSLMGHGDPVVESGPDDLEQVILAVLDDRAAARRRAAAGAAYARAVHDGRRSAAVLAPFLGVPIPPG